MLPCKQQEIYRDFFSPRLSGQIHGPVDKLFQSPGPRIASGSFGKDSAQSLRRLGFVWPKCSALSRLSRIRLAKRCVVHVQTLFSLWFCRWLCLCNPLALFAQMSETIAQPNQANLQCAGSPAQQSPHLTRQEQSPAQQATPGFDHSSKGCSFMHESRFVGKQNLLSSGKL